MTSLMIVEDHIVMVESLSYLLSRMKGLTVAATAASAEAALDQLPALSVDLALIDISLPKMSGIDLVACLREQYPDLRCIVLSGHDEPRYIQQALDAGACGYVQKNQPLTLLDAIPHVLSGNVYLSAELKQRLEA